MSADLHPSGRFIATIRDHGIAASRSKGTTQICVLFETEHGNLFGYFALTNKAAEYTVEKVRAMGFEGDDFSQINDGQCLVGNRCQITVDHEEYNGETRAKVSYVDPEDSEPRGIQRDDEAAKRARSFNALLKKSKPRVGRGLGDDDIPF